MELKQEDRVLEAILGYIASRVRSRNEVGLVGRVKVKQTIPTLG